MPLPTITRFVLMLDKLLSFASLGDRHLGDFAAWPNVPVMNLVAPHNVHHCTMGSASVKTFTLSIGCLQVFAITCPQLECRPCIASSTHHLD